MFKNGLIIKKSPDKLRMISRTAWDKNEHARFQTQEFLAKSLIG
jgi:hypothetical protein